MALEKSKDPDVLTARDRVRHALDVTGLTRSELARKAGVAPSTITRLFDDTVKHSISLRTLQKIERAAGTMNLDHIVDPTMGTGAFLHQVLRHLEEEIERMNPGTSRDRLIEWLAEQERTAALGQAMRGWDLETARTLPRQVHFVTVRGAVEAGAWREAQEWPEEDCFPVGVAGVERYDPYPQFGLVVRGPSMNQIYPEGSVLICVSFLHLGRQPTHGDRVIVEHRRGDLVEATVKEYALENGRPTLYARSNHPRYAGAIELPAKGDADDLHDDEIRVTALVIASIRPEASA